MQKKQFDLHLHTYYSDGKESPLSVLKMVKKAGLSLVSLTDHNSLSHILEAKKIAGRLRLNLISGIELSCIYQNKHLHLLGYAFDAKDGELKKVVHKIQARRKKGILKIAKKLRDLGFDIQNKELAALPAEYYGLAHIIRILQKKPRENRRILNEVGSSDIYAIINHYFAEAKEAYVPEDYLPAVKMIKLIRASGGFVSIAHPGSHLSYPEDGIIASLKACGLEAIEVFTPKHNWDQVVHYEMLAKKLKLTVTAGSNYHEDFHQQDIPIVTPLGFLKTPPEVLDNLLDFLKKRTGYKLLY
ncbi:MAG: PHP domain-containing protein [bacterium]|nr:PHP domain-containing protein [bacterium]